MTEFFLCVAVAVAVLYLPGFFSLSAWVGDISDAILLAPPVSVLCYCGFAIVLSLVGIPTSALMLLGLGLLASALVCLIGLVLRRRGILAPCGRRFDFVWAVYVAVGLAIAYQVYVKFMTGFDATIQSYDNIFHYGLVRGLTQSTDWSCLHATSYPGESELELALYSSTGSFYPNAWHTISALVASFGIGDVVLATNAVNFAFIVAVFPLALLFLFKQLFGRDRLALLVGAAAAFALAAFPWALFCSWPLFPNAVSLSMAPCVLGLFVRMTGTGLSLRDRLLCGTLFAGSSVALVLAQPNSIFFCAVFLAPYCASRVYAAALRKDLSRRKRAIGACALSVFVMALLWAGLYVFPPLQDVIGYYWPPITSVWQACVDFVLLSYPSQPMQPVAALLVIVGAVYALRRRRHIWLVASYLFSGLIYVVSASFGDNVFKHFLSGFWYTDPYRTASVAALCALPLLCLGLVATARFVMEKMRLSETRFAGGVCTALVSLAFVMVNFSPTYELRGVAVRQTAFSEVEESLYGFTSMSDYASFSTSKRDFLEKAKEVVEPDALIINQPFDGSLYAYSVCDLNVLYRYISGYSDKEDAVSAGGQLRLHLDEIASEEGARELVEELGADYLLILERDCEHMALCYPTFVEREWSGILGVNDSTPGFKVVLSEGDMRLYRIVQ